jgi:excinuclease ABC subunit B
MESAIRVEFWGDTIDSIFELDPVSGETGSPIQQFHLYPATQYVTPKDKIETAVQGIRHELDERVAWFESHNRLIEAQRIKMRT